MTDPTPGFSGPLITSRQNPRLKALAALHLPKVRRETGLTLAEGARLCREALAGGPVVETLILAETFAGRPAGAELAVAAVAQGCEVLCLTDACYAKLSELPGAEGVAAAVRLAEPELAELVGADCRLVVAAGVQDPGNAGALVRVAEAAGATGCVFLGGADPAHPRFLRGAMGSSFRVPCRRVDEAEFLAAARVAGVRLICAAPPRGAASEAAFDRADYAPPTAVVVGAEGAGLSPALLAAAATRVYIPMSGQVESLNVAVSAGIRLYQARRDWDKL